MEAVSASCAAARPTRLALVEVERQDVDEAFDGGGAGLGDDRPAVGVRASTNTTGPLHRR